MGWRITLALLLAIAAVDGSGCARPDYGNDPTIRIDRAILKQDVEEFRIVGEGGQYRYCIFGAPSEILYYPRAGGRADIVQVRGLSDREWLSVPAAGAPVRTVAGFGQKRVTVETALGPEGELPDGPSLADRAIDAFVTETGTIPEYLDLRQEVRNAYVFPEERDESMQDRSGSRVHIPSYLVEMRRFGGEAIEARLRTVVLERDDLMLKALYAAKYDTPHAEVWRLETREGLGIGPCRKLLSLCRTLRGGLGQDFPRLEERYDRALEAAMFAAITGRNELRLAPAYSKLYGTGKAYGRDGAVQAHVRRRQAEDGRRRLDALNSLIRRAEAEGNPSLLEDYEKSARNPALAKRAATARHKLLQAMGEEAGGQGGGLRDRLEDGVGVGAEAGAEGGAGAKAEAGAESGSPASVRVTASVDKASARSRTGSGEERRITTRNNGQADEMVVFSRPTTFSDPVMIVRTGGSYPMRGQVREFYEIEFEPGRTGYIHKQFVEEGKTGGE